MRKTKTNPKLLAEKASLPGDFWPDGSFDPDGTGERWETAFVRELVELRRKNLPEPYFSPADAAQRIEASRFALMFPGRNAWLEATDCRLWPSIATETSAEEVVKRCGNGTDDEGNGYWVKHRWFAGRRRFATREEPNDYGRFRLQVIQQIIANRLTPADVAEILRTNQHRFPDHDMSHEIGKREAAGDVWMAGL